MDHHLAIGYAINAKDIFKGFNVKRLKMTAQECMEINGNRHKEAVAEKVWKASIPLILNDVICNSASFRLPSRGMRPAELCMKSLDKDGLVNGRKYGLWQDVDFLASNFKTAEPILRYPKVGHSVEKHVHLNQAWKDKIVERLNNGKSYYNGKTLAIKDYYDAIEKMFPYMKPADIKIILEYGWFMVYKVTREGCDVCIKSNLQDNGFFFHIGKLTRNSQKHASHYLHKMQRKIRQMFIIKNKVWDGYFKTGITEEDYEILKQTGVLRKRIFYKITEEAELHHCKWCKYLIKCNLGDKRGFHIYKDEIHLDDYEIIKELHPLKLKEMMTTNKIYKLE